MHIQPLISGGYFHIYNRGVNGENIFKEHRNYNYFLEQYFFYCSNVMETLAYALLKNHFHLFVLIKPNVEVPKYNGLGTMPLDASKQLGHFFNAYAQAYNKSTNRTGPLFESPFKRKMVNDNSYFTEMICYCHNNAFLHEFVGDFKDWEFSSYNTILNNDNTLLASQQVLDWFGGVNAFKKAHEGKYDKNSNGKFTIE